MATHEGELNALQQAAEEARKARTRRLPDTWYRFARNKAAVGGLAFIGLLFIVALTAPWLTTYEPLAISRDRLLAPNGTHYMGTDDLGRDIFSGIIYGSRVALQVGLIVAIVSTTIGIIIGALAGYYGGKVDTVLMRISEMFQVIPIFFMALTIIAITGPGLIKLILVIAFLYWSRTSRLVRMQYHSIKNREYVEAARAIGQRDLPIMVRHILPNAIPPAIVNGSLVVAAAILVAAGLSFFGLGDPNLADWGQMINNAQRFLDRAWWLSVFPGIAISLTVIAFNLVGDGINDALNPRSRER